MAGAQVGDLVYGYDEPPYPPTRRVCAVCGHDRGRNQPVGLACNCRQFFGAQPPAITVANWDRPPADRQAWLREYGRATRAMCEPLMGNNEPMSAEQVKAMMQRLAERRASRSTEQQGRLIGD